jgi:hypothetical protein
MAPGASREGWRPAFRSWQRIAFSILYAWAIYGMWVTDAQFARVTATGFFVALGLLTWRLRVRS